MAPVATWLASEESREVTGRVFQAGNGIFAVAEGWHKGPTVDQIEDPVQAGKRAPEQVAMIIAAAASANCVRRLILWES